MKKIILLVVAFAAQMNFAQSIFPVDGGNVGIGTINPTQKLDVNGNAIFNGAIISSMSDYSGGGHIRLINPSKISNGIANTWMIYNMAADFGNSLQFWAYDKLGCAGGGMCENRFTIMDNGNVGIGTTNPQQKLVVSNNGAEGFELYLNQPLGIVGIQAYNRSLNGYSKMQLDASQFSFMYGNVGIGIANPNNKLDVNGTIHSKEVKVDMLGWSDFVFKKEYNLPTLEEVEKHIAEKGHLENIPSEEEVLKNGINLGEMNVKLLQKMEEMTLYMIEQNKRMNKLEKENQELKKKVDLIKK